MNYPQNDKSVPQTESVNTQELENEFSDPKQALDFDGDFVFYREDMPQKPKKPQKNYIFLIIAGILLVCSAVFAVLMFIRMNNSNSEQTEQPQTTVAAAPTTIPPLTEPTQAVTETPTEQPSAAIATVATDSTQPAETLDSFISKNEYFSKLLIDSTQPQIRSEGNVLIIEYYYSDVDSQAEEESETVEEIKTKLDGVCNSLDGEVLNSMRSSTGVSNAQIDVAGYDKNNNRFFYRSID